jgi:predicted Fe-Mo cluster-binding NifX family protein
VDEVMVGLCVAIPTDDGLRVKVGHIGDGKFYFHYRLGKRGWKLVRIIENQFAGEHETEDSEYEKRPKIRELNKECDFIVASSFGPGGEEFMLKSGFQVVKVKPQTLILEVLKYIEGLVSREG